MPHPDEGLIHAWLDGELDTDEAARVGALVASDGAWSAAAADARGLIAASARIATALDRAPGRVVPRVNRAPRVTRWWMMRVAAMLVAVVGTTVLLRRDRTVSQVDSVAAVPQAASQQVPPPPVAQGALRAAPKPATLAADLPREKNAAALSTDPRRGQLAADKELAKRGDEQKAKDASSERVAAITGSAAASAASVASPPPAVAAPAVVAELRAAMEKVEKAPNTAARALTGLNAPARNAVGQRAEDATADATTSAAVCFSVRQPVDSVERILRFRSSELADSVRSGRYRLNRDSLVGLTRPLVAIALRCPER